MRSFWAFVSARSHLGLLWVESSPCLGHRSCMPSIYGWKPICNRMFCISWTLVCFMCSWSLWDDRNLLPTLATYWYILDGRCMLHSEVATTCVDLPPRFTRHCLEAFPRHRSYLSCMRDEVECTWDHLTTQVQHCSISEVRSNRCGYWEQLDVREYVASSSNCSL